jgi:hypothetical protein
MVTVFEHVTKRQLEKYVDAARSIGKIVDIREALQKLIDPINEQLGQSILTTREDSRYLICEFDGVRIFTAFENPTSGKLDVSYHPACGEGIFTTIHDILTAAIYAMTLEWHVNTLKNNPVLKVLCGL